MNCTFCDHYYNTNRGLLPNSSKHYKATETNQLRANRTTPQKNYSTKAKITFTSINYWKY